MDAVLRTHGWRLALIVGGLLALVGGPRHPDSDAKDSLRQELATMTADPSWIPSHVLLLTSVVLLACGLLAARRAVGWPTPAAGALRFAGVAMALYSVEAAFHLAAVVDTDRLAAGDFAPVAFTHIGLAIVLYPVSGLAIAYLALKLLPSWSPPQRAVAVAGILGGVLHACSVPTTLIFTETELSPMFAFASVLISVWTIAVGLVGIRAWQAGEEPAIAAVSV